MDFKQRNSESLPVTWVTEHCVLLLFYSIGITVITFPHWRSVPPRALWPRTFYFPLHPLYLANSPSLYPSCRGGG